VAAGPRAVEHLALAQAVLQGARGTCLAALLLLTSCSCEIAGSAAEHAISDTTGYEYIVRKPNGDLVSVTQKDRKMHSTNVSGRWWTA
jgi:outer membrane lipoprotein SlyB